MIMCAPGPRSKMSPSMCNRSMLRRCMRLHMAQINSSARPVWTIASIIRLKYACLLLSWGDSWRSSSIMYANSRGNALRTLDLVYLDDTDWQTLTRRCRVMW